MHIEDLIRFCGQVVLNTPHKIGDAAPEYGVLIERISFHKAKSQYFLHPDCLLDYQ